MIDNSRISCKAYYDNQNRGKRITTEDLIEYIEKNYKIKETPIMLEFEEEIVEENDDEIFSLHKNEEKIIKFGSPNLSKIFGEYKLKREGVNKSTIFGKNISFFSSLLTCLLSNFSSLDSTNQAKKINELIKLLTVGISTMSIEYKKIKLNSKTLLDQLKTYTTSKQIIKLTADQFEINIFVIDYKHDNIYVVNPISKFMKSILLIIPEEENFEPVSYENIKVFNCDSFLAQHLFDSNIELIDLVFKNSEYDDLDRYLRDNDKILGPKLSYYDKFLVTTTREKIKQPEKIGVEENDSKMEKNNKIEEKHNKFEESECEDKIDDLSEIDRTDALKNKTYSEKKTKLIELQKDAETLGILLTVTVGNRTKKKNKKQLIEEILSVLKNK